MPAEIITLMTCSYMTDDDTYQCCGCLIGIERPAGTWTFLCNECGMIYFGGQSRPVTEAHAERVWLATQFTGVEYDRLLQVKERTSDQGDGRPDDPS